MIIFEAINNKYKSEDIQIIARNVRKSCFIGSRGIKARNNIILMGSFSMITASLNKSISNKWVCLNY